MKKKTTRKTQKDQAPSAGTSSTRARHFMNTTSTKQVVGLNQTIKRGNWIWRVHHQTTHMLRERKEIDTVGFNNKPALLRATKFLEKI